MIDRRSPQPRRVQKDRRVCDRRQEPRHESPAQIRFLRAGTSAEEILQGRLLDLSAGGIRILFDEPLEIGDKILAEVREEQGRCFNLNAQVLWAEPAEKDGYHVGCQLSVGLSRRQYRLIQRIAQQSPAPSPQPGSEPTKTNPPQRFSG